MIVVKDLRKAFGDNLLYDNLTFNLPRGGIVGIIGGGVAQCLELRGEMA